MFSNAHLALGSTLLISIVSAFAASRPSPLPAAAPQAMLLTAPHGTLLTAPHAAPFGAPQGARQETGASADAPRMRIEYFRTDGVSARELENVAHGIFRATVPPGVPTPSPVLQAVGNASIVGASAEESMPVVLGFLERLQVELRASQEPTRAPLVTRQFQLRHVGRGTVEEVLMPYRQAAAAPLAMYPDGTTAEWPSITVLDGSGIVIARDTEARLAEIGALLERVDRPAAQVRLSYMLLRGYDQRTLEAEGLTTSDLDQDLPQDLVRDLGALVPVLGFRRMSFGVVQGNALAPKQFSDRFAYGGGSIELQLRPVNFDEGTGALNVERIDFDCYFERDGSSQSFETGARLVPDEYMVLGGVGNVPVFLVLRMTRL